MILKQSVLAVGEIIIITGVKHDDMLWWLLLCVTHLECQYHYHIDVEDNRTDPHEASSCCELTNISHNDGGAGAFVAFFLNTFLNSLLLFVHIVTNSAVFQLPEGKMLSYFGFVSASYCFHQIPISITNHVKVPLSHFLHI